MATYCERCQQNGRRTPIPDDRILCDDCMEEAEASYHAGSEHARPTGPAYATPTFARDTPCPNCGYLMQPLDTECRRCVTLAEQARGLAAAQRATQPPPTHAPSPQVPDPSAQARTPASSAPSHVSVASYVCAGIALFFCPPVFGFIGIVLGVIAASLGDTKWGLIAIAVSIGATVMGMIVGTLIGLFAFPFFW